MTAVPVMHERKAEEFLALPERGDARRSWSTVRSS